MSAEEKPQFEAMASRQFTSWMLEQRLSLAFTTYQTGKLFLIGLQRDGRLSISERTFSRCMGLCAADSNTLYMSSLYQLWRFENAIPAGETANGYDRLYLPQMAYTTGDLDVHDIAMDASGNPVFVNSLFSCLARSSETHSFTPVWKPKFISKLAAEDRCHLNGLAMKNGQPRYVTAVSTTDVNEGWREHRVDGGVVIDVENDAIVTRGLSMPHSPRLHQGTLYLLNSGRGEFWKVDLKSGEFEPIAFCPGYARGLTIAGDFALIGLSKIRDNKTFADLPLGAALAEKGIEARCALQVVDLRSGDFVHSLNFKGIVKELYDVVALPGVMRPTALGFKTDEIRRTITIGDD
jgi:uncharacterized protein (TIGR03032 family)